jgi:hypothetical protein
MRAIAGGFNNIALLNDLTSTSKFTAEESRENRSWPVQKKYQNLSTKTEEKLVNTSARTAGLQAWIGNQDVPNTKHSCRQSTERQDKCGTEWQWTLTN